MTIAQISKSDSGGGGASKVAEQLTTIFTKKGHDVKHFVSYTTKGYTKIRRPLYGVRLAKYFSKIDYVFKRLGLAGLIPFELFFLLKNKVQKTDIIHFHDIASGISIFTIAFLSRLRPVIWTIHDCSPFTGGCLYPFDCNKYLYSCGRCPQLGIWPIDMKFDTTLLNLYAKKLMYNKNIFFICPSQWMANMAYSSKVINKMPFVINNGVNHNKYIAHNKTDIQRELVLPEDTAIVLLSAHYLFDRRKGIINILKDINKIKEVPFFLLLLGIFDENGEQQISRLLTNISYRLAGYHSQATTLSKYYSAADLFVFPSFADNMPLALLESLSCGTSVLANKTGGIPEVIEHEKTGYLLPDSNSSDQWGVTLKKILKGKKYEKWNMNCRKTVLDKFSEEILFHRHLEFYKSFL